MNPVQVDVIVLCSISSTLFIVWISKMLHGIRDELRRHNAAMDEVMEEEE